VKRRSTPLLFILLVPFVFSQCNHAERQKKKVQEDLVEKAIGDKLKEHKEKLESGEVLEGQLGVMFEVMNRQCPIMVDEITRLDSCRYNSSSKEAGYYYTITDKSMLDLDNFKNQITDVLKENLKSNEDVGFFRMYNVAITYKYADSEGKEITTVKILPEDYKEK